MAYSKAIEQELKGIPYEKIRLFKWLCAMRALPFLGVKGSFDHWDDNRSLLNSNRKTYLYAVLRAVDFAAIDHISYDIATNIAENAANAANAANNATARDAANAAAYAAASITASATANATVRAAIRAAARTIDYRYKFEDLILNDLKFIKNGEFGKINHDVSIYKSKKSGNIWENFLDALRNEDCDYWADLYDYTFNNGFKIDKEKLERRMKIPEEIAEKGAAAVAYYLENIEMQGAVYTKRETRLIILGSAGAGKTTLARRLNGDMSYPEPKDSTHGVDTSINLDFNGVKTHIWDFGGQVIYHASHRCFMSANCVYILVINARTEDNRDIGRIEYWLDTIRVYSHNMAKVFIVINESDNRKQDMENYSSFMEDEYGSLILSITNFNIGVDMESVNSFKCMLKDYIEKFGHQSFGKNDNKAMLELSCLFEEGKKVLESHDFERILRNNHIVEEQDQIRVKELFNDLGVALSYDFMEGYVLDPYWISHGVYKVIDYMKKTGAQYIINGELGDVFANELTVYPPQRNKYILDLMEYHKIAFSNEGGTRGWIVPCVASQFKPKDVTVDALPDSLITKIEREGLKEFPADFFFKYVCANKDDIKQNFGRWAMWQTGIVLAENKSSALVELIENRRIEITVWGEKKKEYNQKLESLINELLQEYHFTSHGQKQKNRDGKSEKNITLAMESFGKGTTKAIIEAGTGGILKLLLDAILRMFG